MTQLNNSDLINLIAEKNVTLSERFTLWFLNHSDRKGFVILYTNDPDNHTLNIQSPPGGKTSYNWIQRSAYQTLLSREFIKEISEEIESCFVTNKRWKRIKVQLTFKGLWQWYRLSRVHTL